MLCTQVLNGLVGVPERDVSRGRPGLRRRRGQLRCRARRRRWRRPRRSAYLHPLQAPGRRRGLALPDRGGRAIEALTKAAGFRYRYDEELDQFAHASAIFVATPDGRLARYFYGIEYAPRDLRLGLVEASAGRIGTPVDQILLYCFHYDPKSGKYGAVDHEHRPARRRCRRSSLIAAVDRARCRAAARAPCGPPRRAEAAADAVLPGAGLHLRAARRRALRLPDRRHGVLLASDRYARRLLRDQVPPQLADESPTDVHESGALEIVWTIIPFGIVLVMFVWGAQRLLPDHAAAGRRARDLRHRQAVDVEVPALRRPPGDERAARPGGPAGAADDGLRGRHPQLLRAGLPLQAGRRARAASRRPGSRRRSPASTTSSAPSSAARGTRG